MSHSSWWRQVTIREMLLITAIVAILFGWGVDHQRGQRRENELVQRYEPYRNRYQAAVQRQVQAAADYRRSVKDLNRLRLNLESASDVVTVVRQFNVSTDRDRLSCVLYFDPFRNHWIATLIQEEPYTRTFYQQVGEEVSQAIESAVNAADLSSEQ